MQNKHWLEGLEPKAAALTEEFIDQGGFPISQSSARSFTVWEMKHLGSQLAASGLGDMEATLGVTLLFSLAKHLGDFSFLQAFASQVQGKVFAIAAEMDDPLDPRVLSKDIRTHCYLEAKFAEPANAEHPFESPFLNLAWKYLDWSEPILDRRHWVRANWIRALARWHPEQLATALSNQPESLDNIMAEMGREVIEETDSADELMVGWATQNLTSPPAQRPGWSSAPSDRCKAFFTICHLNTLRDGRYHELVMKLSALPEFASCGPAVDMLLRHRPDTVLETVEAGIGDETKGPFTEAHHKLVLWALEHIERAGEPLLRKMLAHFHFRYGWAGKVNALLLADPEHPNIGKIRKIYLDHAAGLSGKKLADFWAVVAEHDRGLFLKEWQAFAEGKSKMLRETAAAWLLANRSGETMEKIERLIASPLTEERLAAASLLDQITSEESTERLKSLHTSEPTKQVRLAVAAVLAKRGVQVTPEPEKEVERVEDIGDFEASLQKRAKSIRLPKAAWLKPDALPPLKTVDGRELSALATAHIFQCQARGRAGLVEPEVDVLRPILSRTGNAAFAHALLDQWFASAMNAPTRWALDVAGITGDDSIIDRLVKPIPQWCASNHGSRAEWAAHAIALLGSENALGTLDSLIQRYRSQRKYVGAAAALAIGRTAEMMGISPEELAERIVPDFGFDSQGERQFPLHKGSATAILLPDFKIAWKDDNSGQIQANPPGKLSEETEEELKETRKFLKETITRLTARLRDAMIGGRRWAPDLWTSRFGNHPLFKIIAGRLVWGLYYGTGELSRVFRLYPNGLTADPMGDLVDFPDNEMIIGIPHAMEFDETLAKEWKAHFKRFKVKPFFDQLDRPIHRLDSLHANRRVLHHTENVSITAGLLRQELLGKGWALASAGDGGGLDGVWRRFPGCDIEAFLPVGGLHAMSSRGETVKLQAAYFARGNPAKANYREFPAGDRAVSFGDVPPIIYSETLADLQALLPEPQ